MKQKESIGIMSAFLILGIGWVLFYSFDGPNKYRCILDVGCTIWVIIKELGIWLIMGLVLIGIISLFNKENDKENVDKLNNLKQNYSPKIEQIINNKKTLSPEKLQQIEDEKDMSKNMTDIEKSIKRHNKK